MARYINANKNTDLVSRLVLERRVKKYDFAKSYLGIDADDDNASFCLLNKKAEKEMLNKNYYGAYIHEVKKEEDKGIHSLKRKIKIFETLACILAFVSLLMSQIEYEVEYFKKHYQSITFHSYKENSDHTTYSPANYAGKSDRLNNNLGSSLTSVNNTKSSTNDYSIDFNIPENYSGNSVRVVISIICLILCFLSYKNCTLTYKLKKEQKKVVNGIVF